MKGGNDRTVALRSPVNMYFKFLAATTYYGVISGSSIQSPITTVFNSKVVILF